METVPAAKNAITIAELKQLPVTKDTADWTTRNVSDVANALAIATKALLVFSGIIKKNTMTKLRSKPEVFRS